MARKKKKAKLPIAYKPLGFVLGYAGGTLSGLAFRRTWRALRHEDDAPDPLDRDRGWGEILLAAALQGAIFAAVRSVVDRSGAKAVERRTGIWPGDEKKGRA
ncbi:DUF4235 domain-containing protein [Streptomyces sp. enrichment culture]|uniref:DUF4235 domain-containing protein n=1 Tax=Streptomyces sp. enrichment culture TaxID=1795815 RepID=UPI003F560B07